jgi:hypothetical protein
MRIRLIVIGLLLVPSLALADDSTTVSQPTGVGAATLGPATAGTGTSSSADSTVLQPAGTSPLQSTTNDAGGLNPASTNPLQASATGDNQLKVLLGSEADGNQHEPDNASSNKLELDIAMLGLLVIAAAGAYLYWRRRQGIKR